MIVLAEEIGDEAQMLDAGKKLSGLTHGQSPIIIYLVGPLGAGKTTFVRGFLRGLGVQESIKSPTYTLVEPYHLADLVVYHFDLYRIQQPEELAFMGIDDYFAGHALCLIEWPECGAAYLPSADIQCTIEFTKNGRHLQYAAMTPHGEVLLRQYPT